MQDSLFKQQWFLPKTFDRGTHGDAPTLAIGPAALLLT